MVRKERKGQRKRVEKRKVKRKVNQRGQKVVKNKSYPINYLNKYYYSIS